MEHQTPREFFVTLYEGNPERGGRELDYPGYARVPAGEFAINSNDCIMNVSTISFAAPDEEPLNFRGDMYIALVLGQSGGTTLIAYSKIRQSGFRLTEGCTVQFPPESLKFCLDSEPWIPRQLDKLKNFLSLIRRK
jgi:hypothetical protein